MEVLFDFIHRFGSVCHSTCTKCLVAQKKSRRRYVSSQNILQRLKSICNFRMAFDDCVCIVFFAVLTTLLTEGISYLLVYRKESYKLLNKTMEKATKVSIMLREIVECNILLRLGSK